MSKQQRESLVDDLVDAVNDLDDLMTVVEKAGKGEYGKVLKDILDEIEGKINDAYDKQNELTEYIEDLQEEDLEV